MNHRILSGTLIASAFVVIGCSSQQLYSAGQQWQRNECRRLPVAEQDRCLKSNAMSYEEYQKQTAEGRSGS